MSLTLAPWVMSTATWRSRFSEQSVASTEGSSMVKVIGCGRRLVIPSGQRDRAHVPSRGSSIAVDPTVDSAYGSEVFVIADRGALLDMTQTEFSGHRIGMIIAHVDDMKPGWRQWRCAVLWKAKSECSERHETWEGGDTGPSCGLQHIHTSSPSPTRGSSVCDRSVAKGTISAPPGSDPKCALYKLDSVGGVSRKLVGC